MSAEDDDEARELARLVGSSHGKQRIWVSTVDANTYVLPRDMIEAAIESEMTGRHLVEFSSWYVKQGCDGLITGG